MFYSIKTYINFNTEYICTYRMKKYYKIIRKILSGKLAGIYRLTVMINYFTSLSRLKKVSLYDFPMGIS